jgi:hypothetical protein
MVGANHTLVLVHQLPHQEAEEGQEAQVGAGRSQIAQLVRQLDMPRP